MAIDAQGNVVGKRDMKAQTRKVSEDLRAVLEAARASLADVVKVAACVTDIGRFSETHEIRAHYFPDSPPAITGLEISALAYPDLLLEIEAVAVKSS